MKKRKFFKVVAAVLAAAFAVPFFSACGKVGDESNDEELETVSVGSDEYAPYFYRDEDGEFAGIDVELAKEACKRIGKKAVFTKIEWSRKDVLIDSGEIECLWGCFSMTGREDLYAWAGPYMKSRQVLAVRENSGIYKFSDLEGKSVAVQATSKADELLSSGKDERIPPLGHIYCFTDFEHIFAALKDGYADAVAGHETALRESMKNNTGEYRILEETLLSVNLGAAFKKGGGENLARLISDALKVMKNDGFIAKALRKYGIDYGTAAEGL